MKSKTQLSVSLKAIVIVMFTAPQIKSPTRVPLRVWFVSPSLICLLQMNAAMLSPDPSHLESVNLSYPRKNFTCMSALAITLKRLKSQTPNTIQYLFHTISLNKIHIFCNFASHLHRSSGAARGLALNSQENMLEIPA